MTDQVAGGLAAILVAYMKFYGLDLKSSGISQDKELDNGYEEDDPHHYPVPKELDKLLSYDTCNGAHSNCP
jgi:hypothetical protein